MSKLSSIGLMLGFVVLAGFVLLVSIWRGREGVIAVSDGLNASVGQEWLLGEQTIRVEALPGSWRYVWMVASDRWRLLVIRDSVQRVDLLRRLALQRLGLTNTLMVHGRNQEALGAAQRAVGYWRWAIEQNQQLKVGEKSANQQQLMQVGEELEATLQRLMEVGEGGDQQGARELLDQVLLFKLELQK